jgi:RNA polymerase sigma factor (sigma-70 family)
MTASTSRPTDRQLLERIAKKRDEKAFTQLVQRHGPMVLGVCRQILGNDQDAEDAFQATFLVLSSKAGSIRSGEALPNWLFNVATRLARRLRAATQRRRAHEVALVEPVPSKPEPRGESDNLGSILYEEIGRLPDKYRLPFILCYLRGRTNVQAAQQLGCPLGTVFSRLARARERLRDRLTRRGLVISGAVLAAALLRLSEQARAAVPQLLQAATVRRALQFGAGKLGSASNVSSRVANLAAWGVGSLAGHGLRMAGSLLLLVALGGSLSVVYLRPGPVVPFGEPVENRLQGTWAEVSLNVDGRAIPGGQGQVTFEDNQMTLLGTVGTFRIDGAKDPIQLDWIVQGAVNRHILEFAGDQLTLAAMHVPPGAPADKELPRPQDFSPQRGKIITSFQRLEH